MLHPSFCVLRGTIPACHLSSQWVRPSPSPSASGDRRSGHPIARYGPWKSCVWDLSPFSAAWKIPSLGDDRGNGRLFGRSRRKLWVETPGGGDGSRRGSMRTCFMRR